MPASSIVGQTLGHYQVVARIGGGGMGEVFRAQDARLGREVAIKILPAVFSQDQDRLRRFEQEARATAALNHPNILAIYDIGTHDASPYIVSELLEGMTLRHRLQGGALPLRTTIEYAVQIAKGLVAAHEKRIVHRDLKPENLFLTRDGRIKILDFGIAKLTRPEESAGTEAQTMTSATGGLVLGTVGYMSPEQVRGKAVDPRSDIFSFGAILYEMLTGKRAFQGETTADTITAILQGEPAELPAIQRNVPLAMQRIVQHCLEKDPQERCQSARDLVFELEGLSGLTESVAARESRRWLPGKRFLGVALGAVILLAAVVLGTGIGKRFLSRPLPSYRQLTSRRGTVWSARFGPEARTVIYSASFNGQPSDIFSTRIETPESRSFGLANADLLGISSTGEMAVLLRRNWSTFFPVGILARLPLGGEAPREVLEGVMRADWSPDGTSLAVARYVGGKVRLEYPMGKVLYETAGWIGFPRISPKGDRIAFLDHPQQWDDRGWVAVVDLQGRRTQLSGELVQAEGLAWAPGGDEVWFTGSKLGGALALYAVTVSGKERVVARVPANLMLHDIARDGSVLLTSYKTSTPVIGLAPGEKDERDLSWLDNVLVFDLSDDGRTLIFQYYGEGSGTNYASFLRKTDGSPAVRLGDGAALALSPDQKWVVTVLNVPSQTVLLPTGAGETRRLERAGLQAFGDDRWTPDSKSVLFDAQEAGKPARTYLQDISGGPPRPITPEGITGTLISPDGKVLFVKDSAGKAALFSLNSGQLQQLHGLSEKDVVVRWSGDGRWLYMCQPNQFPIKIYRLDPWNGRRELIRTITPADPAGILGSSRIFLSADGKSYIYQFDRHLSELYLAEGLGR